MNNYCENKQNIKVIILAGGCDFGRCPLASHLPPALWPIVGKPVLQLLLQQLSSQGIDKAVVCSNGASSLLKKSIGNISLMDLKFLEEPLPVGTAGCIRDAAGGDTDSLFLIFHGVIASLPDIETLIKTHRTAESVLTVALKPEFANNGLHCHAQGIYICEPSVLNYIPQEGYFDIKEGLIPALTRAGATIHAITAPSFTPGFRDREEYLSVIAGYLRNHANIDKNFPPSHWNGSKDIWVSGDVKTGADVRIYGPVVIMDNAVISDKSVIFGPTIIGRNVFIGQNSLVENSVLWDGAKIGRNCEINRCIIDYSEVVSNNSIVKNEAVTHSQCNKLEKMAKNVMLSVSDKTNRLFSSVQLEFNKINCKLAHWRGSEIPKTHILRWLGTIALVGVFLWSYWHGFVDLWKIWQRSDEYSSGLLVPFLALYILWARRKKLAQCHVKPTIWGAVGLVLSQALRHFGLFYMYASAERLSLVLTIASLVLFLFGWELFRRISPILLFLCLMLPLPSSLHSAMMIPLQHLATISAVFCLETIGFAVVREGNIIHINGVSVAIIEACNGLRMITAFLVIISMVVLLVYRVWWEKLLILISSLPIALLCNTIRLTIKSIAFTMVAGEKWETIFHDFGGYAMMPLALGLVICELWFLTKLTTTPEVVKEHVIVNKSRK